ncbi:hypothetical protein HMPREF3223_01330 [Cutibacterium avidum]|nr:hypothetical protein HMPREF3223_01330 [Cutibacterium avidum]
MKEVKPSMCPLIKGTSLILGIRWELEIWMTSFSTRFTSSGWREIFLTR